MQKSIVYIQDCFVDSSGALTPSAKKHPLFAALLKPRDIFHSEDRDQLRLGPFISQSKHPHDAFKCHQCHCVCRKCSQKARNKASPIAPPSILSTHCSRRISPAREFSIRQIIRHDTLLDNIRRVTCQPKHLCRESTCPEIDGRCRQCCVLLEPPRKHIIRPPPEEKEGTEYQRRSKSMIQSP
jgi:hypothetical protein